MAPKHDDESADSGEDIPFRAKSKNKPAEEPDEEDEDEEEEEYAVEKIISHKFVGKKNLLKYTVKWVGYDETTEEPSENLDNCPDELETYYEAIGGKPEPPSTSTSVRKRGASENSTPTSRGRPSAGNNNNKKQKTESNGGTIRNTEDSTSWKAPAGSWEDRVIAVDSMTRGDDGQNWGFIIWDNQKKSRHPTKVLHQKCPQKMLQFYESHLFFSPSPSDQINENKPFKAKDSTKGPKVSESSPDAGAEDEDAEMEGVKDVAS